MDTPVNLAVGADGGGTTLQAIISACESGQVPARVAVVFGNRPSARAFERAKRHGIATAAIPKEAYGNADRLDAVFAQFLAEHEADLICLAGFLKQLPPLVVEQYRWRIINSHPALLQFFGGTGWYGRHVHEGVLASGMKAGGCSVHFVTEEYDEGPIIVPRPLPILDSDTPGSFAERLLPI